MILLTFLVTIIFFNNSFCMNTIEINLKQGIAVGKIEQSLFKKQDYYTFKGIPFADTPTGELRFQPPLPHQGWYGTLEAFENKPTCMQFSSRMRLRAPFGLSGSEDCLYVSVFSPDIAGKAPVIVFEYNDYFSTWFNGTDDYSPDFLVEEGIVVVTISHRIGILGYLTTEDEVIPGNNGIRDFLLGLEWVQNNIDKFGGDPSKVTLMGSKGGAALANILLYTEKATGLFSSAILQGGSVLEPIYFYDKPKNKAFQLGEALNITTTNSKELLEGLQQVQAEKLVSIEIEVLDNESYETHQRNTRPFTPTIEYNDKYGIITSLPENATIVNDVPIIIGVNSREGLDLVSHFIFDPILVTHSIQNNLFQFPIRTNIRFNRENKNYEEANRKILDYYFEDKSIHSSNILEHAVYVEDVLQNFAIDLAANIYSKTLKSPVFYYIFDFKGEWNINTQYLMTRSRFSIRNAGATILDELCYLLVCTPLKKTYDQIFDLPSEQNEVKVMKKMVRMWSNFAKTGNPTPSKDDDVLKGVTWEPYTAEADNYLHINKQLKMKTKPLGDKRKFWNDFLEKCSKIAVDGVVTGDLYQNDDDRPRNLNSNDDEENEYEDFEDDDYENNDIDVGGDVVSGYNETFTNQHEDESKVQIVHIREEL